MTTTRIVLAAARRISAHFLAEPTGPEFIKTLSAACSRRGNRRLGYGSSTFREFPELASEQHKQVLLFWIWDAELAANLACEEVGDFCMSWNRGNAAWIGEVDLLAMF
jgi:hypothetical protein